MRKTNSLVLTTFALLFLSFCGGIDRAHAQNAFVTTNCGTLPKQFAPGSTRNVVVDINGNSCISGSISASTSGFAPGGNYANLTATGASADVALPSGAVVVAFNTGTTAVSCQVTVGAGVATANMNIIQPGSWFAFTTGSNTHASCIDQTGTASNLVVLSGGTGLPTGAGGGGGGGGGGAITIASGAVASGAYSSGSLAAGAGTDGWDVTEGTKADAAWVSGSGSLIAIAKTIANNTGSAIPAGSNTIGTVTVPSIGSQYPTGATPITASATGTTAATTATLATGVGVTTNICGFSIRANATAAATGNATITGTITGTLNFTQWTAPLASGLGVAEEIFTPCIPASTTNTSIAVVSAAPGAGGVVSVTAWGFTK